MGIVNDMKRRLAKARVDSHSRHWQVEEVWKTIFLKGKAINSTHVEAFLKDESLILTRVGLFSHCGYMICV